MNIFIHYLDKELLDAYCPSEHYREDVFRKICFSIKAAILLLEDHDHIYVPVSNYYESHFARDVLEQFRDIRDLDYIRMVSSSPTLRSFIEKKKEVYPSLYLRETDEAEEQIIEKNIPGIWTPRKNSATADIIINWEKSIDDPSWGRLYELCDYKDPDTFEKNIADIPDRIKGRAFVVGHVIPKLRIKPEYKYNAKEFINKTICRFYIASFLKEYQAVCFKNLFLLPQADDILPGGYRHIDYGMLCRKLAEIPYEKKSLYSYINERSNFELLAIKEKIHDLLENRFNYMASVKREKKMSVFIVHGHDNELRLELKDYLQNTLKMGEPVVLAEKASGGMTVIEKFEDYSEQCDLVFVLLTPDDKYTKDNKSRARQNVIFEMGYFLGKLGRKSGRIILLYKGDLELPSDIGGITYIKIDNGIQAAGESIRKEIEDLKEKPEMSLIGLEEHDTQRQ